ncbi:Bax inhibitor-1/YccA family protein [Corynebacterium lizhenjunii]|uniref:Bax inhibitor-1/YccA family protein n=1 Tax=Corynebacterium lizhenjunii TaxID=2709394 RepID=A0A7T0PCM3_9CORY|nr:Bax inhibitor-1/YccA family protein [Corynebacterium lizhenjunii]QPK79872.1 Bax inhibitor-1/YccA family protein [Corynebacterium lizhenjunii]
MRSSNPVMNSLTNSESTNPYAVNTAGMGLDSTERPITVDDVVTKTGITLGVIVLGAVVNFFIATAVNPGLAMMLTLVGALGGLITVLVASFGKKWGSATVTLIYAAFEGLFVGGFSFMFTNVTVSGASAASMIGQAVLGTIGVFLGMLFVYKTGAVRVTPKFTKILTAAMIGVLVLALGNFLLAIFTGMSPLRDGGALAIVFSLVCIVLGALSFLADFDQADHLIRTGAPAGHAWGVALGLAVTLVWLYTEILRLLSYFQNR